MLNRAGVAAAAAAPGVVIMLISLTGAPVASAAPAPRPASASRSIPASARQLLLQEMLSAWHITRGEGITIAVLSTPVDPVTGLSGKLTTGPDYAPLAGASAIPGTVLASLIAASGPTTTDPFGTIGRAPAARILAETIVDYGSGRGAGKYQADGIWQSIEAKAIRYAANHGAKIIVLHETGYVDTPDLDSAVAYAISRNVVILGTDGAFGHSPNDQEYPDGLPGVIDFSGTAIKSLPMPLKPVRSPVNNSILVTAPDNELFATGPGNLPYYAYGNYSAIAWVAGTIALIKSVYPRIAPALAARALALSASYHPAGGYNTTIGFGLINPIGALRQASKLVKLRATAAPGAAVASPGARLARGSVPGVIEAVRHAPAKLAGFGAAIVVGVALLVLALVLARRWRRQPRMATPAPPPSVTPAALPDIQADS
jgi:hypothetical protein